jgi:hypothetical protein
MVIVMTDISYTERATQEWDRHVRNLLAAERASLLDVVGEALGEEIRDLWVAFEKKLQVSLRLAILEQSGMVPKVCGTWEPRPVLRRVECRCQGWRRVYRETQQSGRMPRPGLAAHGPARLEG